MSKSFDTDQDDKKADFVLTGAGGDIGQQLYSLLKEYQKNVVDYKEKTVQRAADTLVHLAARHPTDDIHSLVDANLFFLNQVLNQNELSFKKFIFISSTSVYGSDRSGLIRESYCGSHLDPYGMTKSLGEMMVSEACKQSVNLRCPAILELNQSKNLLSKFFDACVKNEAIELTNGNQLFNTFIDVNSLCELTLSMNAENMRGQALNVAVKPELTLVSIVETIRDQLKSQSKISLSEDQYPHHLIDIELIRNEFGFEPSPAEPIIINWCKKRYESLHY